MSLLIGFISRGFDASAKKELDVLYSSVRQIPHEIYEDSVHEGVAFGLLQKGENGILSFQENEELLFAAQGRIDNRLELCTLLEIEEASESEISDPSLMLQVYLKFLDKTPELLIGDWSFAAYDFNKKRFFTAQDPHGYTSLYYYIDSEMVVFSNSIKPLLACDRIPKTLNLDKVIEGAAVFHSTERDSTYFESIKLLNPAHRMWVDSEKECKERYWFPEELPLNCRITAKEAAERLREIFTEAVRCRLRSDQPVASMLSGGLDSGSVASIAGNLLKNENISLHTFSHIPYFDINEERYGQYRFGDERPYIESTAAYNGNIIPHYLDSKTITPLQGMRALMEVLDEPIHGAANAYWSVDISKRIQERGFGAFLSGEMGNATISWTGMRDNLDAFTMLKRYGAKSVIKQKLLRPLFLRYVKPLYSSKKGWQEYSYLNPEYARKINLEKRIEASGRRVDFSIEVKNPKENQITLLNLGYNPRCRFGSAISHYYGIEKRDPTGDKRVVEFMLQLPNELFFSETGENKQILKLMMKDILPDDVLFQTKKGLQSADIIERVQPDIPEIEEIIKTFTTDICMDEMFDRERMLSDLSLLKQKNLNISMTSHLIRTIGIMEFLNQHKNSNKAERV